MSTEPERISVKVNEADSVTALLYAAAKAKRAGTTIVLGHGAGADQLSGFMRLFASGLAARGLDALTFNFLYKEQGRSVPDHKVKLESCYSAVIETARRHRKLKANDLVLGGKSMGGRIASQVAASGAVQLAGLVFLGYPLHPPGKPEQLRTEHLKNIRAPMLFVQGSRDAFGTPDEIREVTVTLRLPATLYEVAGGDHSFKVPKSAPLPQSQVYEAAMDEIVNWLRARKKN
jgi:predicted alpha/beta-hydrolase family hydrolase